MHSEGDNMFLLSLVTPPESGLWLCPYRQPNVRAPFIKTLNSQQNNRLGVSCSAASSSQCFQCFSALLGLVSKSTYLWGGKMMFPTQLDKIPSFSIPDIVVIIDFLSNELILIIVFFHQALCHLSILCLFPNKGNQ